LLKPWKVLWVTRISLLTCYRNHHFPPSFFQYPKRLNDALVILVYPKLIWQEKKCFWKSITIHDRACGYRIYVVRGWHRKTYNMCAAVGSGVKPFTVLPCIVTTQHDLATAQDLRPKSDLPLPVGFEVE
jgi:hypothetical protein